MAEIRRLAERALTERHTLFQVLDAAKVATLSAVQDGAPLVVPVLFARDGDRLLVHGSTGAGALRAAAGGAPIALSVTLLDGLVFADSLFESSANYRSAVVTGTARALAGEAAREALDRISDVLMPGRRAEARPHRDKEVAATLVLELEIGPDNWTAKRRTGGPGEIEDPAVWSGVLPLHRTWGTAEPDPRMDAPVPPSVLASAGRPLA
jgi:nitroimidazol reductase NimA-like FMN-containing flavoprotein (pyridoxamine 5'-phosphate oxidase superfamily)